MTTKTNLTPMAEQLSSWKNKIPDKVKIRRHITKKAPIETVSSNDETIKKNNCSNEHDIISVSNSTFKFETKIQKDPLIGTYITIRKRKGFTSSVKNLFGKIHKSNTNEELTEIVEEIGSITKNIDICRFEAKLESEKNSIDIDPEISKKINEQKEINNTKEGFTVERVNNKNIDKLIDLKEKEFEIRKSNFRGIERVDIDKAIEEFETERLEI
jgi:hypothetical protein